MAAGAEIAELYVLLSGVNAPLLASFAESAAAGEEMAAKIKASMAELDSSMAAGAAGGAEAAGAGAGVAALSAEADAAAAEMSKIGITAQSTAGEVQAAFAEMGASIEATGAKLTTLSAEDAATMAELKANVAGMSAAQSEATAGQAALGDAMAGTTAKAATANTTLGLSNNAIVAVGAAAVGTAYEAVKMAGDFQSSITRLNTSAGETQSNLKMVNDGILAMAGSVGYSSDQLSTAMYKVESGGQHGADGLKVLQAAAQGAKTENADLTTVADALTSAMTDYKIPADQAATTTSKLVEATAQGKMTFQELAGSMSAILPIASANHVSLDDILGDLSSMTVHGMSAQQASDNLADALKHMAAPTAVQSKELAALGMNATEVSKSLGTEGLSGTINEISNKITSQMGPDGMVVVNLTNALKGMAPPVQALGQQVLDGSISMAQFTASAKAMGVINDKNVTSFAAMAGSMHGIGTEAKSGSEIYQTYSGALQKAMGDQTGMNVALMIGGQNASTTSKDIAAVSGATADAAGNVQGWTAIQGNFNQKLDEAKAGFGALMISVGEKLLPVLTTLMGVFASLATFLSQHQAIAVALAVVIGGTLVLAFLALTAAATKWVMTSAAGMAEDLAKSAVWVAEKITGITAVTVASEGGALATAAAWVAANIAMIAATGGILLIIAAVVAIAYELIEHWTGVKTFFVDLWNVVEGAFSAAWNVIKTVVEEIGKAIAGGPAEWGRLLGEGVGYLVRAGWDLIQGLYNGIKSGLSMIVTFITGIPGWIISFFTNAPTWLYNAGAWVLTGLWNGLKIGWNLVWSFITGIPGAVETFFSDAPSWLESAGADILHGLWNGFTSVISSIFSGIGDFITGFIHGFEQGFGIASPSTVMMGIGADILRGLWQGLQNMMGTLMGVAGQVFHVIADPFANSGTWLVNAGYNICVGIYNGIASGWGMLTSMVSNLASSLIGAAKSALGIGSPSKVFADEIGAWIAPGLAQGVKATTRVATDAATQLARDVTQAAQGGGSLGGAGLSLSGGGSGGGVFAPAASGGGSGMNLQVVVQGHVWTTQDLVTEIQQQLLRHGIRNNTPGITYAYA